MSQRMHWTALLGMVAGVLLCAARAHAQPRSIETSVRVEPRVVYLGDRAVLTVTVQGTLEADAETPAPVAGLRISPAGTVVRPAPTIIVNGRRQDTGRDSVDINFRVIPSAAGEYEIPGTTVRVNGQPYQTEPATITVLEPARSDRFPLFVEASATSAYVGEPVRVRVTWVIPDPQSVRAPSLSGELVGEGARVFEPADRSWLEGAGEQLRLPTAGGEVVTKVVSDRRAGARGAAIVFERIVIADEPGTLTLGPMLLMFDEIEGTGRSARLLRKIAKSEPVEIEIRPVPEAGKPPHFSGLVSSVEPEIEAHANETDVSVGDPIEVLVPIRADEPIGRVEPPKLAAQPGFAEGLKLSPDGWELAERSAMQSIWRTVVRARTDAVTELPPIELVWFDTVSGEYRIVRSEAIPLSVEATEQVTIDDAEIGVGGEPVPTVDLLDAPASVRANYDDPGELLVQESPDPLPRFSTEGWVAVAAGPPAVFGACVLGAWIVSDRQRGARRRRNAAARAARLLTRSGDDPARVAAAVRGFAADRFGRTPGSLTDAECLALLEQEHDPESIEPVRTVLNTCAEACYAESDQRVSADAARRAIRGLAPRSEA